MSIKNEDTLFDTFNTKDTYEVVNRLYGMIDAGVYHGSVITWPRSLAYIDENGEKKPMEDMPYNLKDTTEKLGDALVASNTDMFNAINGIADEIASDVCPSLVISSTMDMEYAHLDGYKGKAISQSDTDCFEAWDWQREEAEKAAAKYPLRLFPLYSYDPRRYRRSASDFEPSGDDGCKNWNEPFSRILGSGDTNNDVNKIWLGFCLNPALGFRPFDEYCEHLPKFYKKCAEEKIPIVARCAANGIVPHDILSYRRYANNKEREEIAQKRELPDSNAPFISGQYSGEEKIFDKAALDHFYRNYGHPKNWAPVLKSFPDLRLCLSGFGGDRVCRYLTPPKWASPYEMPGKDWIMCIAELTKYENVYADISGIDIEDTSVRMMLMNLLDLILTESDNFKHLKYKLIFGSGMYLDNAGNYTAYCSRVRDFFDLADETGGLWKRVSLINPWNFYLLDENIDKMKEGLANCGRLGVDCEKLNAVYEAFNNTDTFNGGLVNYVSNVNKTETIEKATAPDNDTGALAALEVDEEFVSDDDIKELYWSYGDVPNYKRLSKKNNCVSMTKCYDDLNFHIVTKPDNDGKLIQAIIKNNYGFCELPPISISNNEAVYEKVFVNYIFNGYQDSNNVQEQDDDGFKDYKIVGQTMGGKHSQTIELAVEVSQFEENPAGNIPRNEKTENIRVSKFISILKKTPDHLKGSAIETFFLGLQTISLALMIPYKILFRNNRVHNQKVTDGKYTTRDGRKVPRLEHFEYINGQGRDLRSQNIKMGLRKGGGKWGGNGCGWIAIYNALLALGNRKDVADIIYSLENIGGAFVWGIAGVLPNVMNYYLLFLKYRTEIIYFPRNLDTKIKNSLDNDISITSGINGIGIFLYGFKHYVMITSKTVTVTDNAGMFRTDNKFYIYNEYNDSEKEREVLSIDDWLKKDGSIPVSLIIIKGKK